MPIGVRSRSFNDTRRPWLQTVRGALIGDVATWPTGGNTAITKSLQEQ